MLAGKLVWGSVPDWVGAIGTAGALFFAAWLASRGSRLRAVELARHVAVWVDEIPGGGASDLKLRNSALEPAYMVSILWTRMVAVMANDGRPIVLYSRTILAPETLIDTGVPLPPTMADPPELVLAFTDARGVRWRRDPNGRLKRVRRYRDWSLPKSTRRDKLRNWWSMLRYRVRRLFARKGDRA